MNRKKLDIVVEKLSEAGLQPVVAEVTREIDVFRLIVACFSDKKTAEQKRVQVAKRTRSAFMIKGGDSYCVIAGSLMSEGSAREEQSQLAAKGLEGLNIVKTRIRQKIWRVTVGRYSDMQEVEQSAQILLKRGLEVNIVKSGN